MTPSDTQNNKNTTIIPKYFTKFGYTLLNSLSNPPSLFKFCYMYIHYYYKFLKTYNNRYSLLYVQNNFYKLSSKDGIIKKIFLLSFKRGMFFPTLLNSRGHTYTTLSLGIFLKFFLKPRSFKKSKQLYILLSHFFRKILIFLNLKLISLFVKFIPKYFSEILNLLMRRNPNSYNHPFTNELIYESSISNPYSIGNIFFFNTKPYGFFKKRKKGVVKRKISRKIIKNNLIID
jgi:hypothetical protein